MWFPFFVLWLLACFYLVLTRYFRHMRLIGILDRPLDTGSDSEGSGCSVIITVRNEAATLPDLLKALEEQDHPRYEVIVVNDGSDDGSAQILEDFTGQGGQFKFLTTEKLGKKRAQALGIAEAEYSQLVFTDGDCKPASAQWLSRMTGMLSKRDLMLGVGALRKSKGFTNAVSRWETFQTTLSYSSAGLMQRPYMGVGRNMSYRKELLKKAEGQREHQDLLSGDDDLFIAALPSQVKTGVQWNKDAFTWSDSPQKWSAWWRQKRRHYSTAFRYSWANKLLLGLEGSAQLLFYLLLPLALSLFFWPVVALFFMRYLSEVSTGRRLAEHFECPEFYIFPLYEAIWAVSTAIIHFQNAVWGPRKDW